MRLAGVKAREGWERRIRISKEVDMTRLTPLLTRYSAWLKACMAVCVIFSHG